MECGQIQSQTRQTQNERHPMVVLDLKSGWFLVFQLSPRLLALYREEKGHSDRTWLDTNQDPWERGRVPDGDQGRPKADVDESRSPLFFLMFVRRNKKRWTLWVVEDDMESPGRARVPGAKQIQMSVRVQVESTCTVVVFLAGNFSYFFNSLTSLFPLVFV